MKISGRFFNFVNTQTDCIMKKLILTAAFLLPALALFSHNAQYIYSQISQKEGLSSTVNCIYKEQDGEVWLGTPSGLYSFNGFALRNYDNQTHGTRKVYQVGMDRQGELWALTEKFLLKRNAGSDNFDKITSSDTLVHRPFYSMLPDDEGVWIGGLGKLFRYSDGQLKYFCTLADDYDIRSMEFINDSTILCCSHNGKALVNINNGKISDAPYGDLTEVSATLIDNKGRLWLAFYNNGIEVFEKDGRKICSYNTENSELSNNIVLCLAQRDSVVLAGTDGGGINIIDIETGKITTLKHISGDRSSFPSHSIKSIHVDKYNNIWAGSIRNGLISISQSDINSYKDTHIGQTNGLSNPTVLCLHQGRISDYIWIGTDGEGLNRFDPVRSRFVHFKNTFKSKIVSIADYSDDELLLSVFSDNLYIFNKGTGEIRPLKISDPLFLYKIRYSGRYIHVYNENDGDLIFFANTLYRYDKKSGKIQPIQGKLNKKANYNIIGRSSEGIWLHRNTNIYLLEEDADHVTLKGTHESGEIRCGHMAPDGIIYLATEEGLCHFNTKTGNFGHIRTTLFSTANSVVCDNNARVWVGTEKGLSAYLINSDSFTLFDESDGVSPNEYLPEPHILSNNGDVYLGGVHGLLRIRKEYQIETTDRPVIKLNEVLVDGEEISISQKGIYKTPRGSKKIAFGVSALEKDLFRQRMYRFALSDKEVYKTSVPILSLRQMPKPGTYKLTVACTKRNGEWTEPFSLMTLKVPYPWYLSWWSITGCVLILLLSYFATIFFIQKRKENELKMAMKEQEHKVYEEKVNMLINVSHELRTPLTLIMAPLKRLLKTKDSEDGDFSTLSRIYRQSRRMQSLLDMVLDLRKMEVEGNKLKRESVNFNSWITDAADDIVNEEKAEAINIIYALDPAVGSANIDKQKCDIVLMNILINAIKHSSIGDTITIGSRLTQEGMIRVSITDQGPGIGPDVDIDKLFTQFYQSKSEKYGSGIGLSYSKILVEMHGGRIGVENNPDKGATFWWEIPVDIDDSSAIIEPRAYLNELLGHSSEASADSASDDGFSTAGMRLMLVDDNKDLLDFLREALSQEFAEVITVTGGNAALRELAGGRLPDIIVSDVNMPDGDGFSLCSEIKANDKYSHIPVALLTARGEEQSQSDSYRLGADGFLAKPFEIETLMQLIKSLLKSKAEIRRRYLDEDSSSTTQYGSNEERFILQLNKIIAEHLSDPDLDQQLICREMGVSRALLYNKMKAITGAGTKEYITKIRIERAQSLMESPSLTIAEISDMTGFASQSYFSTAFKNYTGMTPSHYRQMLHPKS